MKKCVGQDFEKENCEDREKAVEGVTRKEEELGQMKNPMISSGFETVTFRFVA
jgi:hypothetical protein